MTPAQYGELNLSVKNLTEEQAKDLLVRTCAFVELAIAAEMETDGEKEKQKLESDNWNNFVSRFWLRFVSYQPKKEYPAKSELTNL